MKTELIGTVFLSEKRKAILLMLMDGPTTVDEIKKCLTGTSSAIMTQIKILLEQGLIENEDYEYRLSYIGEIIVKKMKPLIKTLNVLEEHKDFWQNRDLGPIPEHLLDRIGELGDVIVYEPDLNHLFEPPQKLLNSLYESQNVSTLYSYFCPSCPKNYSELAKKETNFELILTKPVYERLEEEYTEEHNAMIENENSNIYICDDTAIKLGALSVTDDMMLIAFFNKDGVFDHKKVMSFDESARLWGQELFNYYKERATPVK